MGAAETTRFKALMVDVDGVLVNGRPSDGSHWATDIEVDLGVSFAGLRDAFFNPFWEEIVTGRAEIRVRLATVLAFISPTLTAEELLAYWFRNDSLVNEALLRELAVLRSKGLRVFLATNQEHERADYLMNTLGLAARVDGCCYSAAIGHRKPAAAFFDIAAARVGLDPAELLLIDDAAENVRAAQQCGWHAIQWTGRGRLSDWLIV